MIRSIVISGAMLPGPAALTGAERVEFDAVMPDLVIATDDPRASDVVRLLQQHHEFALSCSPPEFVFALDVDGLEQPTVTFCSARRKGELLAVGALMELDPKHAEIKSMHTSGAARGQGVGAAMLEHLVHLARQRGYERISLETGSQLEYEPARALYARAGFRVCGPYAGYPDSGHSVFMALML